MKIRVAAFAIKACDSSDVSSVKTTADSCPVHKVYDIIRSRYGQGDCDRKNEGEPYGSEI